MASSSPVIPDTARPIISDGTPAPANARGAQYSGSSGAALENLGSEVEDIAKQKDQAQQDIWLSQARSSAELTAQKISEDAQRGAQMGKPILGDVQDAWQKHTDATLADIDNPVLKARYAESLQGIGGNLNKSTQMFDYQQQDAAAIHNFRSTNNNKTALYQTMNDSDAIAQKAQSDIGEQTTNIMNLPLAPDKKQELLDETRKGLVLSAQDARIALDPIGFLNENAPARSPQARLNDPNMPRGFRNNNPGNLEGDQGFQGYKGSDAGGYAQFETPEAGLRAMAINLRNQQDMHGLTTVNDIVSKYAPASDGNNTSAYITNVSNALKVQPDDKINLHDPATLSKFMTAAIKQENGSNGYSAKQIAYAAQSAIDPAKAGDNPTENRPDGGVRTGDPLFALLKPDEQQTVIQHAESVYRQQQYFQRQAGTLAGAQLGVFEEAVRQGQPIDPQQLADLQPTLEEAGPATQARAAKLQTRNEALKDFLPMGPVELQNYLQDSLKPLIDSGKATPDQFERYDMGTGLLKTINEQSRTDPISLYSRATGSQIPQIDNASADSFKQRGVYAESAAQLYGAPYKAATPTEAPRWAESFNQAAPAGQRAFLTNFAQGFGPRTADAATQVWGKEAPDIAYAATMLATPNLTSDMAKIPMEIVAGAQRMKLDKENSIPLSKVDERMAAYADILPPGSAAYDNGRAAARALFAARYNQSYDGNPDKVDTVIKDVMGPIVTINGTKTIPPYGVNEDAFSTFITKMTPEHLQVGLQNARGGDVDVPAPLPKNDDGEFDITRDKLRLKPIANGTYQLVDKNNKPYINPDKTFTVLRYTPQDIK